MKKLLAALFVLGAVALAPAANAGLGALAAVQGISLYAISKSVTPHPAPYHLTDACKPQTVQAKGANYVYTTYEHCIAQAPAK